MLVPTCLRRGLFMPWELDQVLARETVREGLRRLEPLALVRAEITPRPRSSFAKVAALESSVYMRNQLLRDTDWASMAHSLEVRVPLVDATLLKVTAPLLLRRLRLRSEGKPRAKPAHTASRCRHRASEDRLHDARRQLAASRCRIAPIYGRSFACGAAMPLVPALGLWRGDKLTKGPEKGLNILALVTDAFGGHGGIAQYNQDLLSALALSSRVGDILVIPRHGTSPKDNLPAEVCQAPPRSGRISYAAHVLAHALSPRSFDVVFCGHLYISPLAALISVMLKKPMWLQLHGIEAWQRPGQLVRAAAERTTLVTAVSRYTRHRFLEWANVPPERARVLPNTFKPQFAAGPKR